MSTRNCLVAAFCMWCVIVMGISFAMGFSQTATREARYDLCKLALKRCGTHVRELTQECSR